MRSTVFLRLAVRMGAYGGAVTARIAAERRTAPQPTKPGRRAVVHRRPLYDDRSPLAGNAHTADSAPPATGADFARLNAELGQTWFSYRKLGPDGAPIGGETA